MHWLCKKFVGVYALFSLDFKVSALQTCVWVQMRFPLLFDRLLYILLLSSLSWSLLFGYVIARESKMTKWIWRRDTAAIDLPAAKKFNSFTNINMKCKWNSGQKVVLVFLFASASSSSCYQRSSSAMNAVVGRFFFFFRRRFAIDVCVALVVPFAAIFTESTLVYYESQVFTWNECFACFFFYSKSIIPMLVLF